MQKQKKVSVPFRGSVFLNLEQIERGEKGHECFRPLPGFCVSQCNKKKQHTDSKVSVPFRGSVFLNNIPVDDVITKERFPSPSGVLCFSIAEQ